MQPVVSELWIYPIKSARGIAVNETRVEPSGPTLDRRWMLVDEDGLFLSQRRLPRMALLTPRFAGEAVVVEAPGMSPLTIAPVPASFNGESIPVRLWRDELRLPHPDPRCSDWFSRFLNHSCRLVHLPDTVVRGVEPPFDLSPWRVSLADGYPLLLIGQASLDALNNR